MMKHLHLATFLLASLSACPRVLLAEGKQAAEHVVIVADMRGLGAVRVWWANLYNASPFWSAVVSVVVIAALGIFLSRVAEIVFAFLETGSNPKPN